MESDASPLVPADADLAALREAAAGCTACRLHESGTQTVFGQGPQNGRLMLVGEQPGDQEDKQGVPFVGPAGRVLEEVLPRAGIDRDETYVTNVVKHFKWRPRGKRRIHQKPDQEEIAACRPWFTAEVATVRPEVMMPLGATAATALLGASFKVTRERGEVVEWADGPPWADGGPPLRVVATVHPSSVIRLRGRDEEAYRTALDDLVADLRVAAGLLDRQRP